MSNIPANSAIPFRAVNHHPDKMQNMPGSMQVVNLLTELDGFSWQQAYAVLLHQVHELCLMPDHLPCAYAAIKSQHYIHQPSSCKGIPLGDLVDQMSAQCTSGVVAFAEVDGGFAAVVPDREHGGYISLSHTDMTCRALRQLWLRWPDGQDYSPVKRRKGRSRDKSRWKSGEDEDSLFLHQANPADNNIGDCVIRGVSAACGISWHAAIDALAASCGYRETTLNKYTVFIPMLESRGFVRRTTPLRYGPSMRADQFCKEMTRTCHHEEPILAMVGRSHVAAVMPFTTPEGARTYKIVDSWDSTERHIKEYWIRPVSDISFSQRKKGDLWHSELAKKTSAHSAVLCPGSRIRHPRFGDGEITRIREDGIAELLFPEGVTKMLSAQWVSSNCQVLDP